MKRTLFHPQTTLIFAVAVIGCGGAAPTSSAPAAPDAAQGAAAPVRTSRSAPLISSFTATPSGLVAGQKATLSWSVARAASISIDHGIGAPRGSSVAVSPPSTTTYTLTARNITGSTSASTTVVVTGPPGGRVATVFTPTAIPVGSADLPNPLRGQYVWLDVPGYPPGWSASDGYERVLWSEIETAEGVYDWGRIDEKLHAAKSRNARFGLRVMPLCAFCGSRVATVAGHASAVPPYLIASSSAVVLPDPGDGRTHYMPGWNSEAYLSRAEALVSAIADRYRDDRSFAWFEIGPYGDWGEWNLAPWENDSNAPAPITDANAARLVNANVAAFGGSKILVSLTSHRGALAAAMAASPLVGIRSDSLGAEPGQKGFAENVAAVAGTSDRWKTAPVMSEWATSTRQGNEFVNGEAQVRSYHVSTLSSGNWPSAPGTEQEIEAFETANREAGYRLRTERVSLRRLDAPGRVAVEIQWANDGVAPTYLPWRVVLGLRGGALASEAALSLDLRSLLPGSTSMSETLDLGTLPSGRSEAYLRVEDVDGISAPMALAQQGRDAGGSYVLGDIVLE